MKRFIIPILLVALLLLVGCNQDMRNGLAGFLGTFGGNAFLDGGMIPSDHSNAAATVEHIANLGENSGTGTGGEINLGIFGLPGETLNLESTEDIKFLTPQDPYDQVELKNNLEDALGSDSEKEALLNELSKPATTGDAKEAAEGTVALLGALLDALFEDADDDLEFLNELFPDLDESTDLTQGDVLMLQLMVDLVGNAADLIFNFGEDDELEPETLLPVVNDVIFAAWVAGEISGTTSLGFSGFGDLSDFVSQMMGEGGN